MKTLILLLALLAPLGCTTTRRLDRELAGATRTSTATAELGQEIEW